MRFSKLVRSSASVGILAAVAFGGQALAQGPAEEDTQTEVGEVIVTAQRREQRLQDVPIAVTALSEEILQDTGVRDIKDLQILTPGLTVTSTTSETVTTARIRGVGTVGDNPGLESSVGIVIDEVYRPRNGVSFGDLGEIERIEVLKGPQGTLFGRNTSAGVINIVTARPSFDFGAEGELTFGNYEAFGLAASVTGPITENLAGRLYAARRTRGGFYDVRVGEGPRTEREDQDQDFYTIRGQLLFTPTPGAELRLIADYTRREENCCVAVQVRTGPLGPLVDAFASDEGVRNPARPFDRVAYSNRGTEQLIDDMGVSLQADIDIEGLGATLTSISAVRHWDSNNGQDIDFTSADILFRPADGTFGSAFTTLSQEFRLAGATDRLNWLVGAFFASEDLDRNDTYVYGADNEFYFSNVILQNVISLANRPTSAGGFGLGVPATAGLNGQLFVSQATGVPAGFNFPSGARSALDRYGQDTLTGALFTHNTFDITEQLHFTFGLRYTMDRKELRSVYSNPTLAAGCGVLLTPAGQARTAAALIARGFPAAIFAPGDPRGPALVSTAVGTSCLTWNNPLFNGRVTNQEREENEWSGTLNLAYDINDDIMVYGAYARGYKAGGFNLDRVTSSTGTPQGGTGVIPVADTSFEAELVDSYELGIRTSWMDGRLLLNGTFFHQEFSSFQLNTFVGTTFVVESIPEVTSTGVDLDAMWRTPIDGLTFQGGLTYAQTEYGEFGPSDLVSPSRFVALSLLPGNQISFAPEWSGSASTTYEREFGNLMFRANLGLKYTSDYNTGSDLLPFKAQEGFTLFNGRVGVGSADDRWRVELWAQNLTDEDYYQVVFNSPLQGSAFPSNISGYQPAFDTQTYSAFLGQPRTYGITLRVRY